MPSSDDSGQPVFDRADSSLYQNDKSSETLEPCSGNECLSQVARPNTGLSLTGFFAWIVIGGMTLLMMFLATLKPENELDVKNPKAPPLPAPNEMASFISQGKWIVSPKAAAELAKQPAVAGIDSNNREDSESRKLEKRKTTYLVPDSFDHGSLAQRWGVSVLKNELEGADEAEKYLATTEERLNKAGLVMTDEQKKMHQSLKTLYEQYKNSDFETSSLDDQKKERIKKDLGWIGELALVPDGTADVEGRRKILSETKSSMTMMVVGFLIGGFLMFIGFVFLVGMAISVFVGRLTRRFSRSETNPNVYAETFAIWMVLFMAGQIVLGAILSGLGIKEEGVTSMAATLIPFFGSLAALVWPVIRGVSISQVASDIGLKSRAPVADTLLAIPGYLMLLPALLGAVILVAILFALTSDQSPENFGKSNAPSHPIQDYLKQGDRLTLGVVFLVACVAAPIVEETMFRGVLYRHLRGISERWGLWISIIIACSINSFIFAAIHPQGILAIPLLMTLAIGFSVVREFRDSIWAPMLMHGLNNFAVLAVSVWLF